MNWKILLALGAVLIIAFGSVYFTGGRAPVNAAPAFDLKDTEGVSHTLADYKGEKIYIKFWASWCSICLAGLEDVDVLSAQDNGFRILTIVSPGFNGEQSREDFIQWYGGLETKNMTVLLDEGGDIARAYGVRAYPTSAFIDSSGALIKSAPGHLDNESIKATIEGIN